MTTIATVDQHSQKTLISIVIVNWNTRELLRDCLLSVRHCSQELTNRMTTCYVVDNASTDGSGQMVMQEFPSVTLISNNENLGFARANNQALSIVGDSHVLLLNSDAVLLPGALTRLFEGLEADSRIGAVGPQTLNPDGSIQNCFGSLPNVWQELIGPYIFDFLTKPWGFIGSKLTNFETASDGGHYVDRVSFACTLIRREALEDVGLLDARFGFYSEDYDWFRRAKNKSWHVLFCPQAQVIHHWGGSSRQRSDWALRQLYHSKRQYHAKHYGSTAEWILRAGFALRFLVRICLAALAYPLLGNDNGKARLKRSWVLLTDMAKPL